MARGSGTKFKLQPADPFDLIRWLARTQNDPRKAVAELVQNAIDARARTVRIERRRLKGKPALVIRDDGEGVLPALPREEALRHIGTHIGHSHKLGLSPSERHARVIAGQYGVGLLGFWAVGRQLELRSRVARSELHTLTLQEDRQTARLGLAPLDLDAPETFTELVISDLHEAAQRPLSGRRLADYLAAELRGPILQTGVAIEVHDLMARGTAQRRFPVIPRKFDGVRLDVPGEIAVDGYPPARVELYLARGAERPAVHLACAGTLVAEDISEVDLFEAWEPWIGRELTGIIDFPAFQVPPGTRRGVVPNAAAMAFARALETLAPLVTRELDELDRRRRAEADRHLVDDLRKALRGLRERLPHYDLPAVEGNETSEPRGKGAALPEPPDDVDDQPSGPQPALFAAGPLARVAIVPETIEIAPGHERRIHARAFDGEGRRIKEGIDLVWSIEGAGFSIIGEGVRPAVAASGDTELGTEANVVVEARQGVRVVIARARVVAAEPRTRERSALGVPKPELVDASGASWRSRMAGDVWQVNAGHEDYLALDEGRPRLRYLIALLGKEIVQRTYAQPGAAELLEHLIAVIAHAERNLRSGPGASV